MNEKQIKAWTPLSVPVTDELVVRGEGALADPATRRPGLPELMAFVLGSVRAHWALSVSLALLAIVAGMMAHAIQIPQWTARSEIVIAGAETTEGPSGAIGFGVNPADVAALLHSPGLTRQATERLRTEWRPDRQARELVEPGSMMEEMTRSIRRLVRGAAALDPLHGAEVRESSSDGDSIVQLELTAAHPDVARHLSERLVSIVRERLTASAQDRLREKAEETASALASAEKDLREAEEEVLSLQMESGGVPPTVQAERFETELLDLRSARLAVDLDVRELEVQRRIAIQQIEEAVSERVGEVVTTQNPRILELQREISELQTEYAAKKSRLNDRHPEMVSLLEKLELRKNELDELRETVVIERTMIPNERRAFLESRVDEIEGELASLSERKLILSQTEGQLKEDLASATQAARRFASALDTREVVAARLSDLEAERRSVEQALRRPDLYGHIRLVTAPFINDPTTPDGPRAGVSIATTGVFAVLLALLVPTAHCAWRRRLVAEWQLDDLSRQWRLPVASNLPTCSPRRLARPAPRCRET